ncbi:MAG: ABC transporter permease [Acidimicrobiia bacterium]|nr:ABC transporter permease [Acidimicrobiia bacterium]
MTATTGTVEGVEAPDMERVFPPPWVRRFGSMFLNVYAAFGLLFLFLPIFVIVAFSFNQPKGRFNLVWQSFTLDNWKDPFAVPELVDAFLFSLKIAAIATTIAVIFGAFVALALTRYRFRGSGAVNLLLVLPLTTPEIVLGASLGGLFILQVYPQPVPQTLGEGTIIIAHVMFCVSFVALTVKARLRGFDWSLEDAAMDLGAGPIRVFTKVTFPLMLPGILAAAMLSFALSLDDFIITLFNASPENTTFPLYIYGARQRALPPQINVLATVILVVSVLLLASGTLFGMFRARRGGVKAATPMMIMPPED